MGIEKETKTSRVKPRDQRGCSSRLIRAVAACIFLVALIPGRAQEPKPDPAGLNTGDKTTVVELWTVSPSGMRPIDRYHHVALTFGGDGTHGDATTIEDLDVPMR